MSRKRLLIQSAFLSGGSIFVAMAAMLVVGKLVTTLPPMAVGLFVLLLLWSDFFNIASSFGLTVALPKLVAAAPEEEKARLTHDVLGVQTVLLLVVALLVMAFYVALPLQAVLINKPDVAVFMEVLWLLPLLFIGGALRDMLMAMLAGLGRYAGRAGGIIVAALAQVLLILVLVLVRQATLTSITLATAASYALAAAWLYALLPEKRVPRLSITQYRSAVAFSWPLHANSLLTFVYQRFDTMLVTAMLGISAAAVYDMAKRIPALLSRVLGAFLVPFLPNVAELIAQEDRERARHLLNRALILTSCLGYLVTLATVVVQEPLLLLLFNKDYLAAAPVLGLLLTATCLGVQAGIMGQTLIALGRPKWVTVVNIFVAVLSIVLNLLLLPHWGLFGAGVAVLGAMIVSSGAQAWLVHREGLSLPVRDYLLLQGLMALCLALSTTDLIPPYARLTGLALFVVGVPFLSIVGWQEVRGVVAALVPTRRAQS
ncbi:MAG: polysaccharide biosynthesis protein [Candidatus Hydrogenedentes bacterium]|nr:polysaccharide biosynthesis protein [Candidatus Hydrogenedentota bacterium]